jgi:hypothetical protein
MNNRCALRSLQYVCILSTGEEGGKSVCFEEFKTNSNDAVGLQLLPGAMKMKGRKKVSIKVKV